MRLVGKATVGFLRSKVIFYVYCIPKNKMTRYNLLSLRYIVLSANKRLAQICR
jgi:hypothetical protein